MGNEEDEYKEVPDFLDSEGGHIGGGSLGLFPWAKISTGPWMVHSNSIKK